ncbi:acyltransferase family protein [Pseudoclavibacter helvolus]|uniref:acyltransferase family protein n=1 Tax=Pseudoclavibacter helvolus TaxID=255205 RepID=UPI003C716D0E
MDLIRGSAILLVLLLHATTIPMLFAGVHPGRVLTDINDVLSPYRMPLLFLLSGLLLERSLRRPLWTYYGSKFRTLVWPYFVWMLVGMLTEEVLTGEHVSVFEPRFWGPTNWLWFIGYLAVYYAAAPPLARIPGLWFAIVPATLLLLSWPLTDGPISDLPYYAAFFFGGLLCARFGDRLRRFETFGLLIFCFGIALVFGGVLVARNRGFTDVMAEGFAAHRLPLLSVVLTGMAGAVLLARRVVGAHRGENRNVAPWLQYIGVNSVVFYVVHMPVMMLVTAVLAAEDVRNPNVAIPACFAAAVTASYFACWLRRYRIVGALFIFPGAARPARVALHS